MEGFGFFFTHWLCNIWSSRFCCRYLTHWLLKWERWNYSQVPEGTVRSHSLSSLHCTRAYLEHRHQHQGSGCCPCPCRVTAMPVPGHVPSSPSPTVTSWTSPQMQASLDIPGLWLTPFTTPVPSLLFWLGAVGSYGVGKGSSTTVLGVQNTFTSMCNEKPLFIQSRKRHHNCNAKIFKKS